ncbi:hypothetical protein PISMIDRAFT_689093 [Pisolithus microcarpus 441]|uniref:Uncharacterized protein n=1 Tax=Pisolithus microcarpus 441 TaxID=765257 RepID=A0A0C9Y7U7_9AGAM|nr:hypothetical protein BKA83DRAFT_4250619 [Pisolithus microcarpus]KIK12971.1 hypothetical protein PISMIDRAFT_689093 [Pisolithus microcarpus 441]
MCSMECFGDQYRGCGHYVRIYQTGITLDCGSPYCKLSTAHMHKTAKNCGCNMEYADHRRVRNLFQTKCDMCQADEAPQGAEYGRRPGRQW